MHCSPSAGLPTLPPSSPVSFQGSPIQPEVVGGGSSHSSWSISQPNSGLRSAQGNPNPCPLPFFAASMPPSHLDSSLVEPPHATTSHQRVESFYAPDCIDELGDAVSATLSSDVPELSDDDYIEISELAAQRNIKEPADDFRDFIERAWNDGPPDDELPGNYFDDDDNVVGYSLPVFDAENGRVIESRYVDVDQAQPTITGDKKQYRLISVFDENNKDNSNPIAYLVPKVDGGQQLIGYIKQVVKCPNPKFQENQYGRRTANL